MNRFLVDGIGPFFAGARGGRVNWSKIPFGRLQRRGLPDPARLRAVRRDFESFAKTVSGLGFNAVTLDDLAHLAPHPEYPARLRDCVAAWRAEFAAIFATAARHGLAVYVTSDVMFAHPSVEDSLRDLARGAIPFLRAATAAVLDDFPEVAGVIVRIGECDGVDVNTDFPSRLAVRTPAEARRLLEALLPVFASRSRDLVCRTWTVGAYPIGDLMWNRRTFDRVFAGLEDTPLIVSLKYGESDFFRFLPLNPLFFRSRHRKFVELQARREYEGFGEYPSFVGWDYERYARQLDGAPNVVGAWVWCQTGGWAPFRRRTFLKGSSLWNEINTEVTLRLFRERCTVEAAVARFCRERLGGAPAEAMLALLRLSDEVVKELLYVDDFARRKLFFRRVRVPPLLTVYWDQILVTHFVRKLMRCFVEDWAAKRDQAQTALRKVDAMRAIARQLGLGLRDLTFMRDTFRLLAAVREYYFGERPLEALAAVRALRTRYYARHTPRYTVSVDAHPFGMSRRQMRFFMRVLLRQQRGYRLVDRLPLLRLAGLTTPLLRRRGARIIPAFAADRAMGIGTVLR